MMSQLTRALIIYLLAVTTIICPEACPTECTCSTTPKDVTVDCGGQDLTAVPESIPYNVTKLNLSANAFTVLGDNWFENFTKLRVLELDHNYIEQISEKAFSGLGELDGLLLNDNNLQTLEQGKTIFEPLEKVLSINLNNNKLHHLEKNLFSPCYALQSLFLMNNQFTTDDLDALNTPSGLTHLDLSGNQIKEVPYILFDNLGSLEELKICRSGVESIDANAFVKLGKSLTTLDLAHNSVHILKREMFQPMGSIKALTIENNPIHCTCGTAQFRDWLEDNSVYLSPETKCTTSDGGSYTIATDDLTQFCDQDGRISTMRPDVTADPDVCSDDSSLSLALLAVDSQSAFIEVFHQYLPEDAIVHMQLKHEDNSTVLQAISMRLSDSIHEFWGLSEDTAYSVCAVNSQCVVWNCMTFRSTTSHPELHPADCSDDLGLAIGLTIAGCTICFIIIIIVVLCLYNAAVITCFCITKDKPNEVYNPNRRRSTKYGATIYREYQTADDNAYEAIPARNGSILSRAYAQPDEGNPNNSINGVLPLPPKKKPIHFIRDPNFFSQGTSAHGATSLPTGDNARHSYPIHNSMVNNSNLDRKVLPLPAIPEGSMRRRDQVESYLEPAQLSGCEEDISLGATNVAFFNSPASVLGLSTQAETYLEPNSVQVNPQRRQTVDFINGIAFQTDPRTSSEQDVFTPSVDMSGSVNSEILINPDDDEGKHVAQSSFLPSNKRSLSPGPLTQIAAGFAGLKSSNSRKRKVSDKSISDRDITIKHLQSHDRKSSVGSFGDDFYLEIENDEYTA